MGRNQANKIRSGVSLASYAEHPTDGAPPKTRRSVTCNLDAGMERSELRLFHIEPVEIVLADRGRYVDGRSGNV
jgi:hypothetical protein